MNKYKRTSKFLCMILRHRPEKIRIELDENGWCDIDLLITKMRNRNSQFNRKILDEIVETDNKQRYAISSDGTRIRANQGHSIDIDLELEEKKPPNVLYHGTVEKFIDSISSNGLMKKNRQHVHLSQETDTASTVGRRRGEPVILRIDSKQMHDDGYIFFISKNKVWLCESIPAKYITRVM